ncbi:hypothetical protein [Tessaracoccus sp. OH4464_COT-324]|uniref:hypothetical protein n=1 Tax=Tessaracoccus sp. OH4464_COT-324 TaxID=2491059 RepID=UPI000F631CAC|nr:hypothetical protein [Tessaracoccus sp. OH4464_COT-324]RRD45708.1 hypothetical protein EII42_10305 [Tessaracoccus sp. OH4464_COT-324]
MADRRLESGQEAVKAWLPHDLLDETLRVPAEGTTVGETRERFLFTLIDNAECRCPIRERLV